MIEFEKNIFIENLNINNIKNYLLYIIFGKDICLNINVVNKILYYNKYFNFDILRKEINSVLDLNNLFNYDLSYNLFINKKILIININNFSLFNSKEFYNINTFLKNENIFIIVYNNLINYIKQKYILNTFFVKNKLLINCDINNKIRFINFIKNKIIKNNNFNNYILLWFYSIYENNFIFIKEFINIFIKNKNNILQKILNNNIIYYININSLIYSILINNFKLSIINLFIIKSRLDIKLNNLLHIIYKYFISILYLKYKLYNINYILYFNNLNFDYKYLLYNFSNNINLDNLLKIIENIYNIEINIIKYNYSDFLIIDIWNKLEIIIYLSCIK